MGARRYIENDEPCGLMDKAPPFEGGGHGFKSPRAPRCNHTQQGDRKRKEKGNYVRKGGGTQANKCAGSELFRKADHAAKRGAGEELEREGGGGGEEKKSQFNTNLLQFHTNLIHLIQIVFTKIQILFI